MLASPCATASLSTYDTVGFTCTIDGYTLSDVTFSESETGGASLAPDTDITVNPLTTANGFVFQFESEDFTDDSATMGTEQYIVQYELDPVFPEINGIDIDLGPADPATLYGQFCGDGTITSTFDPSLPLNFTCSEGSSSAILEAVGNNVYDSQNFPSQVTSVDSELILQLDCDSSTQYFEGGVILATPEPSLLALMIPVLIGLLLLGRKRLASVR